jgi:NDP-sugar pyrophosphorylase family protein
MKPTLLIMAAGIGSRYGTLKQMDKIGPMGETIVDYSAYDAIKAGFDKIVFVIRKDIEQDFNDIFISRLGRHVHIDYTFQELTDVPEGTRVPAERIKPWGTAHAILKAAGKIDKPFAVINADDFYGSGAFMNAATFLSELDPEETNTYCLVGYHVKNTLSEHGHVSRGVCKVTKDGYLMNIVERTHVWQDKSGIRCKNERGSHASLHPETIVSMNMWGFTPSLFDYLEDHFRKFIRENADDASSEFLIPSVIGDLLHEGKIRVKVLNSHERWFGMTYKDDKAVVMERIRELVGKGIYPVNLWG